MDELHAVLWRYLDHSGFGVVRVFRDPDHADDLLRLLERAGDSKVYWIERVSLDTRQYQV